MASYSVVAGSIMETVLYGLSSGQVTMNVFHHTVESSVSDGIASLEASINTWRGAADRVDKYLAMCSEDFTIQSVSAQWIFPTRYRRVVQSTGGDPGLIASPALPPNVQATIEWTGFAAGRGVSGATRVAGIPVNANINGTWVGASRTAALSFGLLMSSPYTTIAGDRFLPITYHRANPALSQRIYFWEEKDSLRVLRRRTVGLGI